MVGAPKGLPPETKAKLYSALRSVLSDAAFIQKQEAMGAVMIIDKRTDPAEHKKFVAAEIAKWSPIIKAAGVYADWNFKRLLFKAFARQRESNPPSHAGV